MRNSFYVFLGLHSFLIGLFPFYIPVYLYAEGFSLTAISVFIGVTGFGFCLSLYVWDRVKRFIPLKFLITLSFVSEILLLSVFLLEKNLWFLLISALLNGVYNCNFWINQRILFLEIITPGDSGKRFGNFQIFVMVVLKLAIFIGGVLLESSGFLVLYGVSIGVTLIALLVYLGKSRPVRLKNNLASSQPLPVREIFSYKDSCRSKWVFVIDGLFLYLESYFWVISLFLIVQESFSRLGLLVIVLTIIFGIIFVVIKNKIDRLPANIFYTASVILYSISWILRALLNDSLSLVVQLLLLAVITFCTSIFRLAFNKRFFDIAQSTTGHQYIIVKSYYSQAILLSFMLIPLILSSFSGDLAGQLSTVYLGAALLSSVYLVYRVGEDQLSPLGDNGVSSLQTRDR